MKLTSNLRDCLEPYERLICTDVYEYGFRYKINVSRATRYDMLYHLSSTQTYESLHDFFYDWTKQLLSDLNIVPEHKSYIHNETNYAVITDDLDLYEYDEDIDIFDCIHDVLWSVFPTFNNPVYDDFVNNLDKIEQKVSNKDIVVILSDPGLDYSKFVDYIHIIQRFNAKCKIIVLNYIHDIYSICYQKYSYVNDVFECMEPYQYQSYYNSTFIGYRFKAHIDESYRKQIIHQLLNIEDYYVDDLDNDEDDFAVKLNLTDDLTELDLNRLVADLFALDTKFKHTTYIYHRDTHRIIAELPSSITEALGSMSYIEYSDVSNISDDSESDVINEFLKTNPLYNSDYIENCKIIYQCGIRNYDRFTSKDPALFRLFDKINEVNGKLYDLKTSDCIVINVTDDEIQQNVDNLIMHIRKYNKSCKIYILNIVKNLNLTELQNLC